MPIKELASVEYLFLDLFAGMDGLGYALEKSGVSEFKKLNVLMIFFETDIRCRNLLQARRSRPGAILSSAPDSEGLVGSVFALTDGGGFLLQTLLAAWSSCSLAAAPLASASHRQTTLGPTWSGASQSSPI